MQHWQSRSIMSGCSLGWIACMHACQAHPAQLACTSRRLAFNFAGCKSSFRNLQPQEVGGLLLYHRQDCTQSLSTQSMSTCRAARFISNCLLTACLSAAHIQSNAQTYTIRKAFETIRLSTYSYARTQSSNNDILCSPLH